MKTVALWVMVTMAVVAEARAAEPDACVAWKLNGYRIGMTKTQAQKVRPFSGSDPDIQAEIKAATLNEIKGSVPDNSAETHAVQLPDGATGELHFAGTPPRLVSWTRGIPFAIHREVLAELRDTFGNPDTQSLGSVAWVSRACDTRIELANDGSLAWLNLISYKLFKSSGSQALE